ncbi:MAG: hydrogenase maturation protease [bacterium]|nr:hydrogenase maturation protease [bacterium]
MKKEKKTQILGLGNTYLGDDAVGIHVIRELRPVVEPLGIDVVEAELGGFELAEILGDYGRAIIVDAVKFENHPPGTVSRYTIEDFRYSVHTAHVHGINLPSALEIIESLGMEVPDPIVIIAIEVKEIYTFGAPMTPEVAEAIPKAAELVLKELREWNYRV